MITITVIITITARPFFITYRRLSILCQQFGAEKKKKEKVTVNFRIKIKNVHNILLITSAKYIYVRTY